MRRNPANYATLPAAQRLVEAGILIKSDFIWAKGDTAWNLIPGGSVGIWMGSIPAPCFTEVWRELPGWVVYRMEKQYGYYLIDTLAGDHVIEFSSFNPTDCLIDLLIWVRGDK